MGCAPETFGWIFAGPIWMLNISRMTAFAYPEGRKKKNDQTQFFTSQYSIITCGGTLPT